MIAPPPALYGSAAARAELRAQAEFHVGRATSMMHRARALVAADRAGAVHLLDARRKALGEHFARYQRFKHGEIFNPVIEHGPASSRIVARTMKIDCMALGEVFAAYHARWLGMQASEWPGYRRDMLSTTQMLHEHLTEELRAIRQLLMISDLYGDRAAR